MTARVRATVSGQGEGLRLVLPRKAGESQGFSTIMSMTLTRREWGKAVTAAAGSAALSGCSDSDDGTTADGQPVPGSTKMTRQSEDGVLERSIVLDLHCDTPERIVNERIDLSQRDTAGQLDIPRMRDGGVTGVFFSIYTSATAGTELAAVKEALKIIDAVVAEVNRHPDDLVLATKADEIIRAKHEKKIAILMGVEGGHMIDSSLPVLRSLYRLGARYMTLTHSAPTPWAGSSGSSEGPKGLTDFGKQIVREMNRLGMMVDISHVSDEAFFDALETSAAPMIASHSSCRALAGHPRNMSDEMLQGLAAKGGVVHINYYNAFLDAENNKLENGLKNLEQKRAAVRKKFSGDSKQTAIGLREVNMEQIDHIGRVPFSRLLDHFEHAVKVAGVNHVGMGSDFDGVRDQLPEGMEDISKIPNLVAGLGERGFTDSDIEKILGGNSLRVMLDVENAAA